MKRLLVVVDFQNDFVNGTLGFKEAEELEGRICEKIREYHDNGDTVFFTYDTHKPDYLETQEGRKLPIEHCIEGTPGHKLYGEVATLVHQHDQQFYKPTFGSSELFERLLKLQSIAESLDTEPFESIELVGLVSNICVLANAVIARTACPEVPVIVDASCTASADTDMNEKALDILEGLQVEVTNRK